MASRRQRDEWTDFVRRRAVAGGGRVADLVRRPAVALGGRLGQWLDRTLPSARFLFAIGKTLGFVGLAVVLGWQFVAVVGTPGLATTEFPLGHLHDVAADPAGRIYVADGFHHRVQRYSPAGEFERGWSVPTAGVFALRTTADGRVRVATARANKLLTYDADGEMLEGLTHQKEDRYQEFASEAETTGPYAIRPGLLPHVVDTRTGETVIATPWYRRLVGAPFPAGLYLVIGLAVAVAGEWRRRLGPAGPPDGEPTPVAPRLTGPSDAPLDGAERNPAGPAAGRRARSGAEATCVVWAGRLTGPWPAYLLGGLVAAGVVVPLVAAPGQVGPLVRAGLVPVGALLGFAAWAGVIHLACWRHDRRTRAASGG